MLPFQLSPLVTQKVDLVHTSDLQRMPLQPPPAMQSSLTASTTRRDTNNHKIPIISIAVLLIVKQLPSSQERLGDANLDRACKLTKEFRSVITEDVLRSIEDKISL